MRNLLIGAVLLQATSLFANPDMNLFSHLTHDNNANVVMSAPSIRYGFSLVYPHLVEEKDQQAMQARFGFSEEVDALTEAPALIARHAQDGNIIRMSNRVYYREGRELTSPVQDMLGKEFLSKFSSSFVNEQTINEQVAQDTENQIKNLLDSLSDNITTVVINAVYFNAKWQIPFNSRSNQAFIDLDKKSQRITMLSKKSLYKVKETADYVAAIIPYRGERLGFVAIMPKNLNPTELQAVRNSGRFQEILNQAINSDSEFVELSLPKFSFDWKNEKISDSLYFTGMPIEITEKPGVQEPKEIIVASIHAAKIEVNTEGTVAAAATAVIGGLECAMPGALRKVVFNQPFVFAIVDLETQLPLFQGQLTRPE